MGKKAILKMEIKIFCSIFSLMIPIIHEHRASSDPDNLRDFLDHYIKEKPEIPDKTFSDTVMVFLPDAIHTLAAVGHWTILYLAAHPEYQTHAQVRDHKGRARPRVPILLLV